MPKQGGSDLHHSVGVMGLGNMGMAIACRLLSQAWRVTGFDIKGDRLRELEANQGKSFSNARQAAKGCSCILIVVSDDSEVIDLLFGGHGLAEVLETGTSLVIHSTISPQTCREVHSRLAGAKVSVIDAAMSGGRSAAIEGTLTLMVGGESAAVERARTVWEAYARVIVRLGSIGSGMTAKLCNNAILHSNRLALYEGIRLACAAGLEMNSFVELLNASSARSWVTERWHEIDSAVWKGDARVEEQWLGQMTKDLDEALCLAELVGVRLDVARLAREHLPNLAERAPKERPISV